MRRFQSLSISFFFLLLLIALLLRFSAINAQFSKPIAHDKQLKRNKYTTREAVKEFEEAIFNTIPGSEEDRDKNRQCLLEKKYNIDLAWSAETGSSIYQTPLIADLFSDGKKEIVVPTFIKYVDVLNGEDGSEAQNFPFSHPSFASHAGALLYDVDKEGEMEIVVTTVNGEIAFIRQDGTPLYGHAIKIPKLKVAKRWYEGLDASFDIDYAMDLNAQKEEEKKHAQQQQQQGSTNSMPEANQEAAGEVPQGVQDGNVDAATQQQRPGARKLKQVQTAGEGWFSPEAKEAMTLIFTENYLDEQEQGEQIAGGQQDRERHAKDPFYSEEYENLMEAWNTEQNRKKFVFVDPHVLATPVICDIDKDGNDDIIVAVSYYFDREYYSDPSHMHELDVDVDIDKYVAGGVVVFDLVTKKLKWSVHLDLTTDTTKARAYIYSSPTVVDLDDDGNLEVIVATSLGFVYALDGKRGILLENFPLFMGEIQGQVTVDDINGDGELEFCVVDFKSNFVCFNPDGKEVWERQISGYSAQAPSVGDINGDGVLDLVVGTSDGTIWAVRGDNGEVLPHFPIKTEGKIFSPALLIRLDNTAPTITATSTSEQQQRAVITEQPSSGLHVVVTSFDGHMYIVDGKTGCVDKKIDIGENSYSMVLSDDITGNGKIDLLVATMNGNVYCLSTDVPYHPLKAWQSQVQSLNGFTSREDHHGIYVTEGSREFRDVVGDSFAVQFEIVDKRKEVRGEQRTYDVKISIGRRMVLMQKTYFEPGIYVEVLPAPKKRMHATVLVQMTNEKLQVFTDTFAVSFNMRFFITLKWVVVAPFVATALVVVMTLKSVKTKLPPTQD